MKFTEKIITLVVEQESNESYTSISDLQTTLVSSNKVEEERIKGITYNPSV
jgi:hypothetical protein